MLVGLPLRAPAALLPSAAGAGWGLPNLSPEPGQGDHGSRRCCVCALQDRSVLHLGLARLALPRGMRGRELPPAGEIPIRTLFLCCNLRGKKTPKSQPPFQLLQMRLFSPPHSLFQHLFEHFTTLPTRNAAELGGLFSKSGRSCARKKHPGVLSKAGEGASAGTPCKRAALGAVETRCQPRLAACGEFPCTCPPALLGILTRLVGKQLM